MKSKPCNSYVKYKAIFIPRCNCHPCWDKFFRLNSDKMYTAAKAVQHYGAPAVIEVHGEKYVKHLLRYLKEETERIKSLEQVPTQNQNQAG